MTGRSFVARTQRSRHAFTLIELLVVIAIIALLLSITMPSLNVARERARRLVCTANLKSIGTAFQAYAAGNNDQMILLMERHWSDPMISGRQGDDAYGYWWSGLLREQMNIEMSKFSCPSDRRDYTPKQENLYVYSAGDAATEKTWFDYGAQWVGYGLSGRRVPWSMPVNSVIPDSQEGPFKVSRAKMPSQIITLWDYIFSATTMGTGWAGMRNIFDTVMLNSSYPDACELYKATMFRHNRNKSEYKMEDLQKGPNALFYDGHVSPSIDVLELTDSNFSISY